jgi:predicted RNase H-like nuclease (RuvC/YqgF family)
VSEHGKSVLKGWTNMKRDFLKEFGLEKEAIDAIMKVNGEDIENAKSEAEELKTEIKGLKEQLKDRDAQMDELKKSVGDSENLKKQIEEMQTTNKANEDAHKAEIHQMKVDMAVERALKDAKNATAVKALLTGLDKAEIAEDGTIKGLDEQIKNLKKSDAYLFNDGKPVMKGANIGEGMDDGAKGMTIEAFRKMSPSERHNYSLNNPEEYKKLYGGN